MTDTTAVSQSKRGLLKAVAALLVAPLVPKTATAAPARELFLAETHVAGTAYYDADSVMDRLRPGAPLVLRREPGNRHDALAIEVLTETGTKLGYVPRASNAAYARLLDAGRRVTARLAVVESGRWNPIRMRLSLSD